MNSIPSSALVVGHDGGRTGHPNDVRPPLKLGGELDGTIPSGAGLDSGLGFRACVRSVSASGSRSKVVRGGNDHGGQGIQG